MSKPAILINRRNRTDAALLATALAIALAIVLPALGCSRGAATSGVSGGHEKTTAVVPPPASPTVAPQSDTRSRGQAETQPPSRARRTPLRVATYNINYANLRLDAVVHAVRQAAAHVVCLQETNEVSADVLRRAFADRYRHVRFAGSVERYRAGGMGVLSSLPITQEKYVPPEHGLFGASVFEVRHGEDTVQIVSVHLQPILLPRQHSLGGVLAVLAAFEAAEQTHRAEMTQFLQHVRKDVPAVIVGDFNSCSSFQAPTLVREQGFVDSFAAVHTDPDSQPTWRWRTRYGDAALRIDYIFHSPALRTVESRIIETAGSDHSLLVSQLEFSEE